MAALPTTFAQIFADFLAAKQTLLSAQSFSVYFGRVFHTLYRFSTVRHADKIVVLDKGKIIEEGSHRQLMAKKGRYAKLFRLQARGYRKN